MLKSARVVLWLSAGACLGITALVLTALGAWTNARDIPERSLVAFNAWASYMLTLLAGAAGAIAWHDVREGRKQHRESLRPLLVGDMSDIAVHPNRIRFAVRNIGLGPALSIHGRVWLSLAPEVREKNLEEVNENLTRLTDGVRDTAPHYELQATALGIGDRTANWIRTSVELPALTGRGRVIVSYEWDYKDVFEGDFRFRSATAERVSLN